jgi:hypothetical protein
LCRAFWIPIAWPPGGAAHGPGGSPGAVSIPAWCWPPGGGGGLPGRPPGAPWWRGWPWGPPGLARLHGVPGLGGGPSWACPWCALVEGGRPLAWCAWHGVPGLCLALGLGRHADSFSSCRLDRGPGGRGLTWACLACLVPGGTGAPWCMAGLWPGDPVALVQLRRTWGRPWPRFLSAVQQCDGCMCSVIYAAVQRGRMTGGRDAAVRHGSFCGAAGCRGGRRAHYSTVLHRTLERMPPLGQFDSTYGGIFALIQDVGAFAPDPVRICTSIQPPPRTGPQETTRSGSRDAGLQHRSRSSLVAGWSVTNRP